MVPIRTEIAAERRVYLASAAVIAIVVVAAFALRAPRERRSLDAEMRVRRRRVSIAGRAVCVLVVVALAAVTFHRSTLYRDPEALWRDTMAKRPGNARAYDNLAAVILQKDSTRRPEAERLLRQAIATDTMYLTCVHQPGRHRHEARPDDRGPVAARARAANRTESRRRQRAAGRSDGEGGAVCAGDTDSRARCRGPADG